MARSFRGGIAFDGDDRLAARPISRAPAPDFVVLPLFQHKGAAALPLVKVGDRVKKGQKIAEAGEGESLPVHSSISGTVTSLAPFSSPRGEGLAFTVENDFLEETSPDVTPFETPIAKAEPSALIQRMKEKGIATGKDAVPVWYRAEKAREKKVSRILIRGLDCEPCRAVSYRLLTEKRDEIIGGAKILLCAIGAERVIFAVDAEKGDVQSSLTKALCGSENFVVASFQNKYPQEDERLLCRAAFGSELSPEQDPTDVGVVIFDVSACFAVYRAFVSGMPVVEQAVTVSGDCVKEPSSVLLPLGTPFAKALEFCGGVTGKPDLLLAGGAMAGFVLPDDSYPVTKGVSAFLAVTAKEETESECIRCGRCIRVCPMKLMPSEFLRLTGNPSPEAWKKASVELCTECGCCSFVCPAKILLTDRIAEGKRIALGASEDTEEEN